MRRRIPGYEQASGLFSELDAYLGDKGERSTHAAVWHRCACRHRTVDCEALGLLKHSIPSGRGVTVYKIPGAMMASLVHQGSDNTFDEAYIAMRSWIASNGMRITGPNREIYWLEESESKSGRGVTEIQFPVSPKERFSVSGRRRMRPGGSV